LELVGYVSCFAYLWWVEGVYRTFSWYRRGKSQAASGYLVATYLIWTGIIAVLVTLYKTPTLVWGQIRFDLVVPIMGGLGGGIGMILNRSGIIPHDYLVRTLDYFGLVKHPKRIV
jgi:prolipoprotein diacylglyceryltransferase